MRKIQKRCGNQLRQAMMKAKFTTSWDFGTFLTSLYREKARHILGGWFQQSVDAWYHRASDRAGMTSAHDPGPSGLPGTGWHPSTPSPGTWNTNHLLVYLIVWIFYSLLYQYHRVIIIMVVKQSSNFRTSVLKFEFEFNLDTFGIRISDWNLSTIFT